MAHGAGSRWQGMDVPKQLIPIGREKYPVVGRTMRQFPLEPLTHLVAPPEVYAYVSNYIYKPLTFREPGSLVRGIWLCGRDCNFALQNVLFLLGDVIFSNKMVHTILTAEMDVPRLFGRIGANQVTGKEASELFALSVPQQFVKDFFWEIMRLWEDCAFKKQTCRLWDLHYEFHLDLTTLKGDYTDDIDSPQEYEQFYKKLNQAVIGDK